MCTSAVDINGDYVSCYDPSAVNCVDANDNTVACPGNVTGAAGSTVVPNPSVPNTSQGSSATALSQLGNTMGQWGATIAGIVSGTPTVVTAQGARTGTAAVTPGQT